MRTITKLEHTFIECMVEQQEFLDEVEIVSEVDGYNTMQPSPFSQNEQLKINDLFESTVAEHTEITKDMVIIVLSDYYQSINKRLSRCT